MFRERIYILLNYKNFVHACNITSLSSHALNNLNKNSLYVAQKVKLVEQINVRINNAQNTQIIKHIEQICFICLNY